MRCGLSVVKKRLAFVQAGDYAEAFDRFAARGPETYYAQRYTVDFVGRLASRPEFENVSVYTFLHDAPHTTLRNGVRTWGVELYPATGRARFDELIRELERLNPTHLVTCAPIRPIIRWALDRRVSVLPVLADSFLENGLRAHVHQQMLAHTLNDERLPFVCNHNLAASRDLERIGVRASKILPYDWPAIVSAASYEHKPAPERERPLRLLYVGMLMETKGVGDVLRALHTLTVRGVACTLSVVGKGEREAFEALAFELGIEKRVSFLGTLPHEEVIRNMRAHDVVIVPSHHAYPEGLPMTLYESLCTRTPLVASDHPMFRIRLAHDENALIFRERDSVALANAVQRLRDDPALYESLSLASARASEAFLCPLKWDQLLTHWLAGGEADARTLLSYALGSGRYDTPKPVTLPIPAEARTLVGHAP
jgi:glycosyltransferase involved in cell wall biosynthesis